MTNCYFEGCEREPETEINTRIDGKAKVCKVCANAYAQGVDT